MAADAVTRRRKHLREPDARINWSTLIASNVGFLPKRIAKRDTHSPQRAQVRTTSGQSRLQVIVESRTLLKGFE